jgi:hypothetical protein
MTMHHIKIVSASSSWPVGGGGENPSAEARTQRG